MQELSERLDKVQSKIASLPEPTTGSGRKQRARLEVSLLYQSTKKRYSSVRFQEELASIRNEILEEEKRLDNVFLMHDEDRPVVKLFAECKARLDELTEKLEKEQESALSSPGN